MIFWERERYIFLTCFSVAWVVLPNLAVISLIYVILVYTTQGEGLIKATVIGGVISVFLSLILGMNLLSFGPFS